MVRSGARGRSCKRPGCKSPNPATARIGECTIGAFVLFESMPLDRSAAAFVRAHFICQKGDTQLPVALCTPAPDRNPNGPRLGPRLGELGEAVSSALAQYLPARLANRAGCLAPLAVTGGSIPRHSAKFLGYKTQHSNRLSGDFQPRRKPRLDRLGICD